MGHRGVSSAARVSIGHERWQCGLRAWVAADRLAVLLRAAHKTRKNRSRDKNPAQDMCGAHLPRVPLPHRLGRRQRALHRGVHTARRAALMTHKAGDAYARCSGVGAMAAAVRGKSWVRARSKFEGTRCRAWVGVWGGRRRLAFSSCSSVSVLGVTCPEEPSSSASRMTWGGEALHRLKAM
jgi:hypothetical protein